MTSRANEEGFTLVELMVVLVIIGLAATAVVLAAPAAGGGLGAEAERFAARAKAARDAAIVEARPIALSVNGGGYAFSRRSGGQWRPGPLHEWDDATEVEVSGVSENGTRFDSTGLADPLRVTLRRRGRALAVDIGQDGSVNVRR